MHILHSVVTVYNIIIGIRKSMVQFKLSFYLFVNFFFHLLPIKWKIWIYNMLFFALSFLIQFLFDFIFYFILCLTIHDCIICTWRNECTYYIIFILFAYIWKLFCWIEIWFYLGTADCWGVMRYCYFGFRLMDLDFLLLFDLNCILSKQ